MPSQKRVWRMFQLLGSIFQSTTIDEYILGGLNTKYMTFDLLAKKT